MKYAVIVAAGTGSRIGGPMPKQYLPLEGKPVIQHCLEAFVLADPDTRLIVVAHPDYFALLEALMEKSGLVFTLVPGGETRSTSVVNGLALVPPEALVAVHDAARPRITVDLIDRCYAAGAETGAATAAVPAKESLRQTLPEGGSRAVRREEFWVVQTPQTFKAGLLQAAYATAPLDGSLTDDASVAEAAGYPVQLVMGSYANIKITTPEDLKAFS